MSRLREIIPGLHVPSTVPNVYSKKAQVQVRRFRNGERNYTRLNDKGTRYLKIDVGPFWRLLSRNQGHSWELMNHERYNNEIRK
ncbi:MULTISPECIES: hypothetical protein [Dickeya]|uniref:ParE family toxin-like protein n=1 Tax=Dickeya TaxID=204037 RepID=UPI00039CC757|nr:MULTISPECIES: hypothetical protein [Dickeya]MCI4032554.1 hypothetical protein [Dickeya dianthicola]MCI4175102.1 hypothetical protein [Dickeya dianthicola]MCI4179069.1 hypothetical protein [Dickeya dianthicola]MCI4180725.1 hypothetical protein [Dickeya dianthicola]MCI4195321.1 hypothetical protein [Dickeya dianthicola]